MVRKDIGARNSIMERMTPNYMVLGIGSKTESYKYKAEIISDEQSFYRNEKTAMDGFYNQFLDGKMDKNLRWIKGVKYFD